MKNLLILILAFSMLCFAEQKYNKEYFNDCDSLYNLVEKYISDYNQKDSIDISNLTQDISKKHQELPALKNNTNLLISICKSNKPLNLYKIDTFFKTLPSKINTISQFHAQCTSYLVQYKFLKSEYEQIKFELLNQKENPNHLVVASLNQNNQISNFGFGYYYRFDDNCQYLNPDYNFVLGGEFIYPFKILKGSPSSLSVKSGLLYKYFAVLPGWRYGLDDENNDITLTALYWHKQLTFGAEYSTNNKFGVIIGYGL